MLTGRIHRVIYILGNIGQSAQGWLDNKKESPAVEKEPVIVSFKKVNFRDDRINAPWYPDMPTIQISFAEEGRNTIPVYQIIARIKTPLKRGAGSYRSNFTFYYISYSLMESWAWICLTISTTTETVINSPAPPMAKDCMPVTAFIIKGRTAMAPKAKAP